MTRLFYISFALAVLIFISLAHSVLARGNDWTITDGSGEQIQVKNGFFGHTDKVVEDRLGDGFRQKKGFFGSKETDVSLLGNQFQAKKGWFGSSDVKGHDILGDSIKTRKGFFGRRTTTVDVSGAANVLGALISSSGRKPNPALPPLDRQGAVSDPLTPLGDPGDFGGPPQR